MTGARFVSLLLIWAALDLGCEKKRAPSEQYTQAHQLFSKLYAAKLEDAFEDPQIGAIEQLLNEVAPESADFPSAQELRARISEGRAQIQTRREKQRAALNAALAIEPYQRLGADRAPAETAATPQPDAGAAQPVPGMGLAEFTQRFNGCFQSSEPIQVTGQGLMDSWELKDIANCRERHPGFDGMLVLTDAKQVAMNISKKQVKWTLPDGGRSDQPTAAR